MAQQTQNPTLMEAIFALSRLMKETMVVHSEFATCSMLQMQVMIFLKKNPHARMTDLARQFKIELPSATSLINTLTKLNLVVRGTDEKDRRIITLNLTEKGKELFQKAMKERAKKVEEMLKPLSEKDKSDLLTIIQKMLKHFETHYEK